MLSWVLLVFLAVSSAAAIGEKQSDTDPNQWMSFLISSIQNDHPNNPLPTTEDQHRGFHVIEYIIKYVSRISSSERFIDNLVNRQREPVNKLKVLIFLNRCFRITQKVLQRDLTRRRDQSNFYSTSLTLEELQLAQTKVADLLRTIDRRMAMLKTWIPPTVPFLGL